MKEKFNASAFSQDYRSRTSQTTPGIAPILMSISDLQLVDETCSILGLSHEEFSCVLDIRYGDIANWEQDDDSLSNRGSVQELHSLALLLKRELIETRIPIIIRTPDEKLGKRSVLDAIKADGVASIYRYLTDLFSYSG